jgi:hypothetical protein
VQRSTDALSLSLRNRPDIAKALNVRRRAMGLPEVRVFDNPKRTGTNRPHTPRATTTRSSAAETTRVFIVAAPGRGAFLRWAPHRPFQVEPGAWDLRAINSPDALWGLRSYGHDSEAIDSACFGRLRAEIVPRAGLVIEWTPRMDNAKQRLVVQQIRAGRRAVSVGMAVQLGNERTAAGLDGRETTIVTRARLDHVALLAEGEEGRMPQASAWVFRSTGGGEAERQRQRDAAVKAALALR